MGELRAEVIPVTVAVISCPERPPESRGRHSGGSLKHSVPFSDNQAPIHS